MSDTLLEFAKRNFKLIYVVLLLVVAALTFAVLMLKENISLRKQEARQVAFPLVNLDENTIDPVEWGKNFPRQYDGYRRTVDTERTKYGGSEAMPASKLERDPRLRDLFAGYAFSVDYRDRRGHAYMLSDQDMTQRVKQFKQPGTCLHCHASIIPAFRQAGKQAGVPDDQPQAQVMKGFEKICAMPYAQARKLVTMPVACIDCHDPKTMQVRVTRPGFINGIQALARSNDPVPHLASIERWRKGDRKKEYDVNAEATRQEMRSFVCGQCHVEYYFKGTGKLLTYPWYNGLKVEQIERYYDNVSFTDWKHKFSGAPMLKAQHPEFEMWNQGIHARSGVACADCHMPYKREGAIKISDHHVRSPLLNASRACQVCHPYSDTEIKARVETIQDRTRALMDRTENAVVDLIHMIQKAQTAGATDAQLAPARQCHRQAQWRWDFVAAENSMGFHAAEEAARILGEAIDYARQGQVAVLELSAASATTLSTRPVGAKGPK